MLRGYELLETVGKGSYGKIIRARRIEDGEIVAIKKVALDRLTPQEQNDTLNEVKLMQQLDHPNIVRFFDAMLENQTMIISMEYLPGGDLARVVKAKAAAGERVDEEDLWRYCADIALGIKYLHDRRVVHRDIKCSNMLITANGHTKIGDFGFSKLLGAQQLAYSGVGTPLYMSPELMSEQGYNEKSDIWAFGCMLYELAALRPPFNATNQVALARKIATETPAALPEQYSREYCVLVNAMLHKTMDKRPDIAQVLSYPPLHARMEAAYADFSVQDAPCPLNKDEAAIWREITESIGKGASLPSQLSRLVAKLVEARKEVGMLNESLQQAEQEAAKAKLKQQQQQQQRSAGTEEREAKLARDLEGLALATEDLERARKKHQSDLHELEAAKTLQATREAALKKWEAELAAREAALANREAAVASSQPRWETRTPSPLSGRQRPAQQLVVATTGPNLSISASCSSYSSSSYTSSGSGFSSSGGAGKENAAQHQQLLPSQLAAVTPIKSPASTTVPLQELSRENLLAMEHAAPPPADKAANVRAWVATTPTTPSAVSRLPHADIPQPPATAPPASAWDHAAASPATAIPRVVAAMPPPLPVSPIVLDAAITMGGQQPVLHRIIDRVAAAPPTLPLATPDRPAVTHTPKFIQFPGEHFGLCPPMQPGAKIGALFAWRRQQDTRPTPANARLDSRVVVSSVWANKEHCSLKPTASHLLLFVRGNDRLAVKAVHTRLARDSAFRKSPFTPSDQRRLPCTCADSTTWFFIEHRSRSEIAQFILEFESPNLVEEVVVARATKLLNIIEQAAVQPTTAVPAVSATPLAVHAAIQTPKPRAVLVAAPPPVCAQPAAAVVYQPPPPPLPPPPSRSPTCAVAYPPPSSPPPPATRAWAPPPVSPRSFASITSEWLHQATQMQMQLNEAKRQVAAASAQQGPTSS